MCIGIGRQVNFFGDQQWGDATGSAAKLLKDEARPIAVYFAKLPELVLHRERPGEKNCEDICHIANRDFRDRWISSSKDETPRAPSPISRPALTV